MDFDDFLLSATEELTTAVDCDHGGVFPTPNNKHKTIETSNGRNHTNTKQQKQR